MTAQCAPGIHRALTEAARRIACDADDPAHVLAAAFGLGGWLDRVCGRTSDTRSAAAQVMRNLHTRILWDAAVQVSRALTEHDIRHFFFKGVALIHRVYERADRDMSDVDLFIPPGAQEAAITVFRDLGYEPHADPEQSGPQSLRAGLTLYRNAAATEMEQVTLDVHWAVEPVEYFLPRPNRVLPADVWSAIVREDTIPVPHDEHHLALIVHHLVHHDLVHIRSLVDAALLWERLPSDGGRRAEILAGALGVRRALRALGEIHEQELGLPPRTGVGRAAHDWRGRRLRDLLHLPSWFAWAAVVDPLEHVRITPARFRRRLLLLDRVTRAVGLVRDAVAPPRDYLAWRWPDARSGIEARVRHLRRLAGKVSGRLQ